MNDNLQATMLRRIYIIGGPGSGKSTLARKIGTALGMPIYDLDTIAFEGKDFHERPLEARQADVRRIAVQPSWVAEGIFLGWIDELLRAADVIIWLDYLSWRVAAWRIIVRFVRWAVAEARRQPGLGKFTRFRDYARHTRQLIDVLYTSRLYYNEQASDFTPNPTARSRAATARQLGQYQDKVIHCRTSHATQALLSRIGIEAQAAQQEHNA